MVTIKKSIVHEKDSPPPPIAKLEYHSRSIFKLHFYVGNNFCIKVKFNRIFIFQKKKYDIGRRGGAENAYV